MGQEPDSAGCSNHGLVVKVSREVCSRNWLELQSSGGLAGVEGLLLSHAPQVSTHC